ncbi:MAG: Rhomboid family protein [Frankiales bacterium]|nr:Rhomboid family protein [Frankiales bacterium]
MKPASVGFQCPDCVKAGSKSLRPVKAAYGGRVRQVPYVTYGLIAINVIMLVVTTRAGGSLLGGTPVSDLFAKLALRPCPSVPGGSCQGGVAQGDYYRLLTSMFLHFGIIHLALNMYSLYLLGPTLEQAFGQVRFGATYLLAGLGGAALSYALGDVNELGAGASGAVFGLFGAFYVLGRKRRLDVSSITVTIAINLYFSFQFSGYIDWRAHVGGLLTGAAVGWVVVYSPDTRQRTAYQAGGMLLAAAVVVAVVAARTAQLA